ncbi:MAG: hypothetical protein CFE21_00825 [Bacteroidetes bacterium B1(2017)]|nr:MAG: hypothetical protein CFE21_00825 [Bacteroidetes bacterium B1(2017)]
MKIKAAVLFLLALGAANVFGIKPEKAKIQKVTVYLQGAHLYYSEQVNLVPGNNEFIFENISAAIVAATLQASAKGGTLMEIKHQIRYKERKPVVKQYGAAIAMVMDSLEENEYSIQAADNHLSVLAQEKKMLLNNRLIRGDSPKDSLPLLRESMAFTREKLNEILEQELKWNRHKDKLNKEKNRLTLRHQELELLQNGDYNEDGLAAIPIQQVVATVYAEQAGLAQVNFNYFVQNANWIPNYDLIASSSTNQIQLKYFAHVSQTSGLNWSQANLTLSTSNPMERNIKPALATWYLGFQEYRKFKSLSMSNSAMPMQAATLNTKKPTQTDDVKMEDYAEAKDMAEYINITENLIRTEYEIRLKYEIESDGKAHKVMIREQNIPMTLAFAAVPKVCSDAFLMGRVSGWEDLGILPGAARIYFDNGYVGETFLNNQSTTDTLDLNLGKDKSIVMTRKKIKEKNKVKTFENERIETRSIELIIRNTKSVAVEMNLEDQIPVAMNTNEIKVTLLDADGASLDESTGFLSWNLKMGAKETKKIVFTYEIRYPKNKVVYGL